MLRESWRSRKGDSFVEMKRATESPVVVVWAWAVIGHKAMSESGFHPAVMEKSKRLSETSGKNLNGNAD